MDCPVCKTSGIDDKASRCPNCGSDLTLFRYLENIRKNWKSKRYGINTLAIILLLFVIGVSGGMVYWQDSIQSNKDFNTEEINKLRDEVERLENEKNNLMRTIIELRSGSIEGAESNNEGLETTADESTRQPNKQQSEPPVAQDPAPRWTIHIVKPGETLFSIARKEYGNGHKYKKIMKDNDIQNSSIKIGQRLKIEK